MLFTTGKSRRVKNFSDMPNIKGEKKNTEDVIKNINHRSKLHGAEKKAEF